jgi:hypothetical protein
MTPDGSGLASATNLGVVARRPTGICRVERVSDVGRVATLAAQDLKDFCRGERRVRAPRFRIGWGHLDPEVLAVCREADRHVG